MLGTLLSLVAPVSGIVREIAALKRVRAEAEGTEAAIAADERIKALESRRDVLVAEAGTPLNALVRGLYAVPPAIYFAKLWIWDKVLGWGTTDPFSEDMRYVLMAVIGFYFVQETALGVARVVKRR